MTHFTFGEAYVRHLVDGDPEVAEHFTGYFGTLLCRKLSGKLRSVQAIEDVKQETFLRVLKTLREGGLHYPERLGAFVNSVCNNILLETYRAKTKHCQMSEGHWERSEANVDLENDLVTCERKQIVLQILDELSAKDRELLRMILEERDKADIGRTMRVSKEYVRVLLHRAKARFKAALVRSTASGMVSSASSSTLQYKTRV